MIERQAKASLTLFGTPSLVDAAGRTVALPRMAFVLALYLLLDSRQGQASRTEIADFLWPHSLTSLTNLRQLLARIRAAQRGVRIFAVSEAKVAVDLSVTNCDLIEFRELAAKPTFATADRLLEIFGTGLMADGRTGGADTPDTWVAMQAEKIRSSTSAVLSDLVEGVEAIANPAAVQRIATRLIEIDPHCEAAWRSLIQCHARAGQRRRMADIYEQYQAVMRRELGQPASVRMDELFRRLSSGLDKHALVSIREPAGGPHRALQLQGSLPRFVALAPRDKAGAPGQFGVIADLLIEDVTIGLCAIRSIDVVAPHTAWQLGDGRLDDTAAETFRIGYVLDTRVLEFGGSTKLVLKLFGTSDRSILWADRVDLSEATGEGCYRRISIGVIAALGDAIDLAEQARYETDQNPTAYYWHLQGQNDLKHLDLRKVRRARKSFQRAAKADPQFAPAWSGRARSLHHEWLLLGRGEEELLSLAEKDGLRATHLDPKDARGFREIGLARLYMHRFDECLDSYAHAERLSPNHADIIADHADALAHAGRPEDGLAKMGKALNLNPLPPDQYWWVLGGIHFQLGRYRDAIETMEGMQYPSARFRLVAACWAMLGDTERARFYAAKFLDTYPDFRVDRWLALVPNRNPDDRRHYERGLRAAGLT